MKDNNEQKEKDGCSNLQLKDWRNQIYRLQEFFRATLDIGEAYINHALSGKPEGHFQGIDNRGRHTPANTTPEYKLKKV